MNGRPKTVLTEQLGKDDADAFDALARSHPRAAYQQSRAWAGNAPRRGRHDYLLFLCRDGDTATGVAVVRRTKLAAGAWLATVQRGPLVAAPERLGEVVTALMDALGEAGCCTLVLGPRYAGGEAGEAQAALRALGFRPVARQALHTVTGKISLAGSEEEIIARFKQRGRRGIRKASAATTVREATAGDLAAAQALLDAFHARRPDYDSSGQLGAEAQRRLIAAEGGAMLIAEEAGRMVGWHSFVRQGRDAIWLSMATDGDGEAPRSYLLLWEAVRRARALGLDAYDLAGLAVEGEETGRDQFKNAFAPVREELLPAQVRALKPVLHAVFFNALELRRRLRGIG